MPFQREHITLEQRMGMVTTLLDHPGQYGLVSDLARAHDLSRQSIYELLRRGREGLTASLQPRPPGRPAALPVLSVDRNRLERAMVTLTVAGHASLEGVQTCLAELLDVQRSPATISAVLDRAAAAARGWREQLCPPRPVRADLDEIFAGSTPHLALVDCDSTLILALERADSRDSTAWGVTLLDQAARGVVLAEAASDGARGLAAGLAEAGVQAVHLRDLFHVVRDLVTVGGQLEKGAYAALGREERARLAEAEARAPAPRRGRKRKTALSLAEAEAASRAAIQGYDDYRWLVGEVRETLEPVDAASGRLHSAAESRRELGAAVALLGESVQERVRAVGARLERAIDGLVAYQERLAGQIAPWLAQWGEPTVALIGWAWRHRHGLGLTSEPAVAAAFPTEQHAAVRAIWAALAGVHRGSSLVECVNSLLRPHLLVHRGADQGLLDLLACHLNHRVFARGKRQGKSPLQLAGLPDPGDWLAAIGFAPKQAPLRSSPRTTIAAHATAQTVNRKAA